MKYLLTLICLIVVGVNKNSVGGSDPMYNCSNCEPQQIHIAFGEENDDIVVTWTTIGDTQQSLVQFGMAQDPYLNWEATGQRTSYENLRDYRCGSRFAWSKLFYYTTFPERQAVLRAAIYGDMGVDNAQAIPYLQQEADTDSIHFILHLGDFAYDMNDDDSHRGDQFMQKIQPFAAIVPFMVCPGNHEYSKNFTQYKSRMTMPNYEQSESMFYSWNIGPIHFVSINTEAYYFLNYGLDPLVSQFRWLVKDLKEANSKKNRKKQPWIIMYGHRPMYCSGEEHNNKANCLEAATRTGLNVPSYTKTFTIEPLLMKYGVDIAIWAHEHMYERTWPLYDFKVYNGSTEQPYLNPRAPIHIVTGAGGCLETPNQFVRLQSDWCAFRSTDYSYTRLHAHNKTHIYFEQVSLNLKGKVIDSFWVVQKKHGSFRSKNH
ncbi:acid phosphatase type 7-like isoform X2 [Hyposmocoma kahamanoa]|uniref:acid phosphatase type 7-like isoform X2 n=1 Tax=Hyposmocoma kahamanoa TaxID=1477025 RepID=UPI000E6D640D|nr:acid phosphatase type 7-like isoform X2 [Hyposmocoma kahamanoa]